MNHEPSTISTPTLIVITGPTASGKTTAAIKVARYYNTVVVSADSRQFYREMSIGTAKPTHEELNAVQHHFIDNLSISQTYTAGDYEKEALALLDELFKTHPVIVLAGGSGLFINAVCEGFDKFPDIDPAIREKLNKVLDENGITALQERLKTADPDYYAQVDLNNPQRVIRALEVFESSGTPYSAFRKASANRRPFRMLKFGLNWPREVLYNRINSRVDEMIKSGLIEEVRSLLTHRHVNALNTVGYSELFDYLDGKTDLDTAIALIKQNTRRFAKRQMTWFGRDKEMIWVDGGESVLEKVIGALGK